MRIIILTVVFLVTLIPAVLHADGGIMPFDPDARVFEPSQKAIIAWDGKEEIFILSTDLSASESTKALEVVPMPSEPTAKKGDIEAFDRATEIIDRFRYKNVASGGYGGGAMSSADAESEAPAGEVTFHEKIGPHDINVVHVNDAAGFVKWVEDYLKKLGQNTPKISEPIKKAVNEYLKDGFKWFVFDVIELGEETKTRDAIQYQFKSKKLFYPMRISRAQEGPTFISLIVLSPKLVTRGYGLQREKIDIRPPILALSIEDLKSISDDIGKFFNNKPGIKLREWEIRGTLSEFDKDVIFD